MGAQSHFGHSSQSYKGLKLPQKVPLCGVSGDYFDILVCQGNNGCKLNNFNLTEEMEMDDLTPDADPDQAEDELN